jgi:flavin-dependent dehydrogenase
MDWLSAGPLEFRNRFGEAVEDGLYPAGDALSFVDPFTGTGLAGALITGALAGECAATGVGTAEYVARCRRSLGSPFLAATLFRAALRSGWAEAASAVVPGDWLVRLTRPRTIRI